MLKRNFRVKGEDEWGEREETREEARREADVAPDGLCLTSHS